MTLAPRRVKVPGVTRNRIATFVQVRQVGLVTWHSEDVDAAQVPFFSTGRPARAHSVFRPHALGPREWLGSKTTAAACVGTRSANRRNNQLHGMNLGKEQESQSPGKRSWASRLGSAPPAISAG
jgi:hypothetical protein